MTSGANKDSAYPPLISASELEDDWRDFSRSGFPPDPERLYRLQRECFSLLRDVSDPDLKLALFVVGSVFQRRADAISGEPQTPEDAPGLKDELAPHVTELIEAIVRPDQNLSNIAANVSKRVMEAEFPSPRQL